MLQLHRTVSAQSQGLYFTQPCLYSLVQQASIIVGRKLYKWMFNSLMYRFVQQKSMKFTVLFHLFIPFLQNFSINDVFRKSCFPGAIKSCDVVVWGAQLVDGHVSE